MLLKNFSRVWRFCNSKQIRQGITKNGKDNLKANQNTTTNVDGSNTSNDGTNYIQKKNEGNYDRQNAYWAFYFIQKIVNCSDHNFPFLQQTLVNMKYDQLKCNEPINEKSHKYMKGFYDIFSKEGPLLDQIVFSQQRYQKGQGVPCIASKRIVYYPTQITQNMFGLFHNRNTYAFVAGLRGIGKSFAIMQYCQLMNLIAKYRIQMRNKKLEQIFLSSLQMNIKPFYWTIERNKKIENESQAIQLVLNLWKIILAQCDSVFKQENKTVIQQLQKQLRQYITQQLEKEKGMNKQQFHMAIQDIANKQTATKFKLACKKLKELCELIKSFYKKQNINIILFIDQINTLASIFRQTKQALQKSQTKKFSELESDQQKEYVLGRVNDDLRVVLNSLSDYFFHNSSADLEKCYKYDNRSQNDDWDKMQQLSQISLKMIYGNTHTNRKRQNLDFQLFFNSQSYQQSMKNIFQFQLCKKMNVSKQFYQRRYGTKIQQIIKKWVDEKLYLFKIQPLLIRQGVRDLKLNQILIYLAYILKLDAHVKSIIQRKGNNLSDQNTVQTNQDISKHYQNIAEAYKNNKIISNAYHNIGQIYKSNGSNQTIAKGYYNLAQAHRNIQNNQNIIKNYQNIAKAYQKNQNIEIMNKNYQNIINIYESLIDQYLNMMQKSLKIKFQNIQDMIVNKIKQTLETFINKRTKQKIGSVSKQINDYFFFFGTIYNYLQIKHEKQQSNNTKQTCLQVNLSTTNIFGKLFDIKKALTDDIINKLICHEIFYCKNLVLKNYVGDTVLYKALKKIYVDNPQNFKLFQDVVLLVKMLSLTKAIQGHFYQSMVLLEFQVCKKVILKFNTSFNSQRDIMFNIAKQPKVFPAFKNKNTNQNNQNKQKQMFSLERFRNIIQNQIKQKYQHNLFDFCYPISSQQSINNQKAQSEATDFILIGKRDNNFQINFIQVTIKKEIHQKVTKFGKLLSKIKQFYHSESPLQPTSFFNSFVSPIKINFFVVGSSVQQTKYLKKKDILSSALSHISTSEQKIKFQDNFNNFVDICGAVNFSNQQKNLIQIFHKHKIGPVYNVIEYEVKLRKQIQLNKLNKLNKKDNDGKNKQL